MARRKDDPVRAARQARRDANRISSRNPLSAKRGWSCSHCGHPVVYGQPCSHCSGGGR